MADFSTQAKLPSESHAVPYDLRNHFARPDAVAAWKRVIQDSAYSGYRNCMASLQALTASPGWAQIILRTGFVDLFILGGGTPDKESHLLSAALRNSSDAVRCIVVDLSPYMIAESVAGLSAWVRANNAKVSISSAVADFEEIDQACGAWRGPRLFALLGGTFGNLNETATIAALARASKAGDITVITVETVDEAREEEYRAQLLSNYQSESGLDFIAAGLPIAGSSDHAARRASMSVEVVDAYPDYSDVPGTIAAVTLATMSGEGRRTVAVSKRYRQSEIIRFFGRAGFAPACAPTPAPGTPTFQQIVLVRI